MRLGKEGIWNVYFARVNIARGYLEGISATFWASSWNYDIDVSWRRVILEFHMMFIG
jgi:hypothetical protein